MGIADTLTDLSAKIDGYNTTRDDSLYNRLCDHFGARNIVKHPYHTWGCASPSWGWIVCGKSLSFADCEALLAEVEK